VVLVVVDLALLLAVQQVQQVRVLQVRVVEVLVPSTQLIPLL
jgi:hypothetical protein